MFSRKAKETDSFTKSRTNKSSINKSRKSFRDHATTSKRVERVKQASFSTAGPPMINVLNSPIVTLSVGPSARLFACHEEQLCVSPYFTAMLRGQFLESTTKMVELPDEIPEVFSCVLEYLYKGDYYPRLLHNKRKNTWELEDDTSSLLYSPTSTHARSDGGRSVRPTTESTVYDPITGQTLLKDTLIYCVAEKYGLDSLKRLALRKQGLQSGIQCATILSSARYAYEKTPDSDSKLRAHYLALIIRSRGTFKRSGTMQQEMERGGTMFFDLFVAMCNHMDDISTIAKSPR